MIVARHRAGQLRLDRRRVPLHSGADWQTRPMHFQVEHGFPAPARQGRRRSVRPRLPDAARSSRPEPPGGRRQLDRRHQPVAAAPLRVRRPGRRDRPPDRRRAEAHVDPGATNRHATTPGRSRSRPKKTPGGSTARPASRSSPSTATPCAGGGSPVTSTFAFRSSAAPPRSKSCPVSCAGSTSRPPRCRPSSRPGERRRLRRGLANGSVPAHHSGCVAPCGRALGRSRLHRHPDRRMTYAEAEERSRPSPSG